MVGLRGVTDKYPVLVGNPGKPIGWMCRRGERLTDELECLACQKQYLKTDHGLEETRKEGIHGQ